MDPWIPMEFLQKKVGEADPLTERVTGHEPKRKKKRFVKRKLVFLGS
jgi:hypothetical protein